MDGRTGSQAETWADLGIAARVSLAFYVAAELLFFALAGVGFLATVFQWRAGGYLLLVGLTLYLVGRQLAMLVYAYAEDGELQLSRDERAVALAGVVLLTLAVLAAYAGLLGWDSAAYLLVAGLTGHFVAHVVIGWSGYRRAMARSWPKVAPLLDDDDW